MSQQTPNSSLPPFQDQPQYPQQPMQSGMYPQQPVMPPQQPSKKKHTGRNAIIAAIVVVVLLAACGGIVAAVSNAGKSANTGTVVNNNTGSTINNTQATSAPAQPSTFKIGQVVSIGNTWQITVLSAKTDAGGQFNTPQTPGDVYLVIQVSVKNISSQSQTISSLAQWNLQDTTGQKYNVGIDTNAGAGLDGAVAAGMPLKGALTYEVPKTVHNFVLTFQNDITSSDQTIWNITV